jgi:hypothetical protein
LRVGIISVFTDYHRRGAPHRGALQPQVGPLIAALLPSDVEVEIVNDTWDDPDWSRNYDLLFISTLHSDFDRARQIAHYFRVRGATTVLGGIMASTYPHLVAPYFDVVAIGDPEDIVPGIVRDFRARRLQLVYRSNGYAGESVPTPRLDLLARKMRVPLAFEVTRGCPFTCDFCGLTAFGTRFETRAIDAVVRDIRLGRALLERLIPRWKQRLVMFYDNNLGGNPAYLRAFCRAVEPLGILWGTSVTFNILTNPDLVRTLYRAGCRSVFVGLESFNTAALEDMDKRHNTIWRAREVIARCRDEGILVMAGLMVSPIVDDIAYIESLPDHLESSGLHVPSFVSFETPIPGTPFFKRLAALEAPAFVPNALLRDFSGYTLTVRPRRAPQEAFVAAYRRTLQTIYRPARRLAKLADDLPRLLLRGSTVGALIDVLDQAAASFDPAPSRTFVAGTDTPPPEAVPLREADFESAAEMQRVTTPWRVTDERGRVLPWWLDAEPFDARTLGTRTRRKSVAAGDLETRVTR